MYYFVDTINASLAKENNGSETLPYSGEKEEDITYYDCIKLSTVAALIR